MSTAWSLAWIVLSVGSVAALDGLWAMFVKAGRRGWHALIPIYNFAVMCEMAG